MLRKLTIIAGVFAMALQSMQPAKAISLEDFFKTSDPKATNAAAPVQKTILPHFHISGSITETATPDAFGMSAIQPSFIELIGRVKKAREDDNVPAVIITIGPASLGTGQLEELRNEFMKLREAKKPVYVHTEDMQMGTYVLYSAASNLSMVPTSSIWLTGLYSESPYLKGMLDKIGVEADMLQMGDFKAAGEMFTRTAPTESAKENMNWLLDGLYGSMVDMIAEARNMKADKVRELIDGGPYTADEALAAKLIDSIQYRTDFLKEIKKTHGVDAEVDNDYGVDKGPEMDFSNPFSLLTTMFNPPKEKPSAGSRRIAVIYVEGSIVSGHAEASPFSGGGGTAYSGDIRKALIKAKNDRRVKAVVLRVDSPGGSALASEIILHAVKEVQKKKPVFVSMGNLAASGGYYVSTTADEIWADEMTITASIGVIGGKIIMAPMWEKIGIGWHAYKRGANADLMSTNSKFNETQRKKIHDWMNETYGTFKDHVTKGRNKKLTKPIEEIASGRVFTGKQALELGLVDKIGGMDDAIEAIAKEVALEDYNVVVMPEQKDFFTTLLESMSGKGDSPTDISVKPTIRLNPIQAPLLSAVLPLLEGLDPQKASILKNAILRLELIRSENVIMMMPQDILIR